MAKSRRLSLLAMPAYVSGYREGVATAWREMSRRKKNDPCLYRELYKRHQVPAWHSSLVYSYTDRILTRRLGLNPWRAYGVPSYEGKRAFRAYDLGATAGWNDVVKLTIARIEKEED